jgi:hypothetical protein
VKKSLLILVPCLALATLAIIVWVALTFNVNTHATTDDDEVLSASLSTGAGNVFQ